MKTGAVTVTIPQEGELLPIVLKARMDLVEVSRTMPRDSGIYHDLVQIWKDLLPVHCYLEDMKGRENERQGNKP